MLLWLARPVRTKNVEHESDMIILPTYPTRKAPSGVIRFKLRYACISLLSRACEILAAVESFHLIVQFTCEIHLKDIILGDWQRFAEKEVDDLGLGKVNRLDRLKDISVLRLDGRFLDLQVNRVQRDFFGFLADLWKKPRAAF